MTPQELQALCQSHGGQKAVAERLGYNPKYLSDLICGRQKISDKIDRLLQLVFEKGE